MGKALVAAALAVLTAPRCRRLLLAMASEAPTRRTPPSTGSNGDGTTDQAPPATDNGGDEICKW